MSEISLKWDSAEVSEGKLQVELEGDPSDEWKQSFEHTVALLGGGRWGDVQLEEEGVNVAGVRPGTEDKLRHFLESVIVQANATEQRARDKQDDSDDDTDEDSDEEQDDNSDDEPKGDDEEMTERFREFGSGEDGAGDSKGSSEGKSSSSPERKSSDSDDSSEEDDSKSDD